MAQEPHRLDPDLIAVPTRQTHKKSWFLGFKRDHSRIFLRKFITEQITTRMPNASGHFIPKAYDLERKASVTFDSEFLANQFCELCTDTPIQHEENDIRVRVDRALEVRTRNRLIGKLRSRCEDATNLQSGRFAVGSNNPKGKIFITEVATGQVWVLFNLSDDGLGGQKVEVNAEDVVACGMTIEVAQQIAAAAQEECRTPARD